MKNLYRGYRILSRGKSHTCARFKTPFSFLVEGGPGHIAHAFPEGAAPHFL